ncbi:hypothetical protein HC928_07725 [bacterium]|nr:hypothetical protein [bacterium]
MFKQISSIALSATIIAANMAPVLANPTNVKNGNSLTVNSVAPKSSLVEIEGRTLTDAEAAKVEGEAFFVPFVFIGAAKVIGTKTAVGTAVSAGKWVVGTVVVSEGYYLVRKKVCNRWSCW